jgi:hypothetical protein
MLRETLQNPGYVEFSHITGGGLNEIARNIDTAIVIRGDHLVDFVRGEDIPNPLQDLM